MVEKGLVVVVAVAGWTVTASASCPAARRRKVSYSGRTAPRCPLGRARPSPGLSETSGQLLG